MRLLGCEWSTGDGEGMGQKLSRLEGQQHSNQTRAFPVLIALHALAQ